MEKVRVESREHFQRHKEGGQCQGHTEAEWDDPRYMRGLMTHLPTLPPWDKGSVCVCMWGGGGGLSPR